MPENNNPSTPEENANAAVPENMPGASAALWQDPAGIPTTPVAPPGGAPVWPGDDLAGIPTTPIAPPGGSPVWPDNMLPWPDFPVFTLPTPSLPPVTYSGQVRFLNASTNGQNLDVLIDGRNIFSGSTFATVSTYIQVSDGFHTVTVRRTNGPILYQRTLSFVSGEKVTMVILDTPGGVTLSRVSDMGCTNVPAGYGCLRVANMSYSGSRYDVRTFSNQVVFGNVDFKEVTTFKQTSSGNYTFFVTASQPSFAGLVELPVIILAAITGGCSTCTVNNPLLTFNVNVRPGRAYTAYIIGNPWSNLYQVFTLES